MAAVHCLAARKGSKRVEPWEYEPRPLGEYDVEVEITHCGVCHSDVHQVDNDWKLPQRRPLVPGHEVVGIVSRAGPKADLPLGQRVGAGPQVGACLSCAQCKAGNTQYCRGFVDMYQGVDKRTGYRTHGGFAERVILDSRFTYALPAALPSAHAAPLLCAGLTVFSPLKRFAKPGARVGVAGIGGLGHMALQLGRAMGYEMVALSHSPAKRELAGELGATAFVDTSDAKAMRKFSESLDLMIVTISGDIPWGKLLQLMAVDGTMCLVGVPTKDIVVRPFHLLMRRVSLVGSLVGSPEEVREMLQLAAKHNIRAMITELPMTRANEALDRVRQGKPRFRDVLVQDFAKVEPKAKL